MSRASTHSYETIYILKSGLSEADTSAINQKVDNVITKFQGKLIGRDDWGIKEMAYAIEDDASGKYFVIHYTGNGGVVEEIERHFKISPDVIRFLTVAVEADYDYSKLQKQVHAAEEEMKKNREMREQRKSARGAL